MDRRQERALSELAKLFVRSQNLTVSGRALRARLKPVAASLVDQRALAASLSPEFAEHQNSNSLDDQFRPTLRGLLASYPPAADAISSTLEFFREKYRTEPDFLGFSWDELHEHFQNSKAIPQEVKDLDKLALLHVLDVAGLSSAWYGSHWGAPRDIEELLELQDAEDMFQRAQTRTGAPAPPGLALVPATIFIGHGTSGVWRELKDFIQDRLKLKSEEFNQQAVAGRPTQARLLEMLSSCSFAFLVMTADDDGPNGTRTARPNVIHELGLFQGRLGFERAIVLLEDGCAEFSNIVGLTQLRFPAGRVTAVFEDVRKVLENQGLL